MAFSPAERFRKLIDSKYLSGNEKIERKEIDNIIQCCSKIDEKQLDMLIDRVEKAKKIYTAGSDAASFIAQIMNFRMSIFGYPFMYIDSARVNLAVSMMSAEAEDVLFLFDFPDYNKSYRYVVNYAHEKGMIVVLITDYARVTGGFQERSTTSSRATNDTSSSAIKAGAPLIEIGERRVGKECRSRWSPYH